VQRDPHLVACGLDLVDLPDPDSHDLTSNEVQAAESELGPAAFLFSR